MKTLATTFLLLTFFISSGQSPKVYSTKSGAIRGYDPVSYFTKGEPTKGSEEFTAEWNGATWYFSSAENLEAFKQTPEDYAPQFGGYCAYAVSQGYTYQASPEAWKIVDDRLYLNYSKGIQRKWETKQAEFIKAANTNWPGLIK
ncbi:MAG: YHS domain-containing (seleno)protein [Bacteroidota bacterium]